MEDNPFKVFMKLIMERIRQTIEEHLPEPQFGFRRGRSTLTAVELLLKNIWEPLERKAKYFIDFTKAFNLLDRALIHRKLKETLGRDSVWKRVIDSIIKWNKIRISDNLDMFIMSVISLTLIVLISWHRSTAHVYFY